MTDLDRGLEPARPVVDPADPARSPSWTRRGPGAQPVADSVRPVTEDRGGGERRCLRAKASRARAPARL